MKLYHQNTPIAIHDWNASFDQCKTRRRFERDFIIFVLAAHNFDASSLEFIGDEFFDVELNRFVHLAVIGLSNEIANGGQCMTLSIFHRQRCDDHFGCWWMRRLLFTIWKNKNKIEHCIIIAKKKINVFATWIVPDKKKIGQICFVWGMIKRKIEQKFTHQPLLSSVFSSRWPPLPLASLPGDHVLLVVNLPQHLLEPLQLVLFRFFPSLPWI